MKKTIIGILIVLLCGGAIAAYYIYNKPYKDIASALPDYSVTATSLYSEYEKNEKKANKKYLNKVIKVSGKVAEVKKDSVITIMLESGDIMGLVACELDEHTQHGKIELTQGENITMKGILTGKLIDVILVRCVIVT